MKNDWTKLGNRITVESHGSSLSLTCESQTIYSHNGTPTRQTWNRGWIGFPSNIPLSEMIKHSKRWLESFDDDELTHSGIESLIDSFNAFPLPIVPAGDTPTGNAN